MESDVVCVLVYVKVVDNGWCQKWGDMVGSETEGHIRYWLQNDHGAHVPHPIGKCSDTRTDSLGTRAGDLRHPRVSNLRDDFDKAGISE